MSNHLSFLQAQTFWPEVLGVEKGRRSIPIHVDIYFKGILDVNYPKNIFSSREMFGVKIRNCYCCYV